MYARPVNPLFPYTTLFRSLEGLGQLLRNVELVQSHLNPGRAISTILLTMYDGRTRLSQQVADEVHTHSDRKSTRLNSSHVAISYAVFCLQKESQDQSTSSG